MDLSQLPPAEQEALLNGPALAPPAGVVSYLNDPPNGNGLANAVTITCLVLTTLVILSHAYSRVYATKKVRAHDLIPLFSYGCFIGFVWLVYHLMFEVGWFVHQWNVRLKDMTKVLWVLHVGSVLYDFAFMGTKAAILLDWLHIFAPTGMRNTFFWATWIVLILNTIFYILSIFLENLYCTPYQAIWDKTIPGRCLNQKVLDLSSSCINMLSDIVMLALPQHVIWRLRLSPRKKISVSLIYAVGIFACVAAGFRLAATASFFYSEDITYASSSVAFWALAEMMAAFLICCVPSLPRVARDIGLIRLISSSVKSWTNDNYPANRGSSNRGVTWPAKTSAAVGEYRRLDGDIHALSDLPRPCPDSDLTEHCDVTKPAILRTTQFTSTDLENQAPDNIASERYSRQHPWTTAR